MADQDGAVVILDPNGDEHEFPSGFDPSRAAAIVRARFKAAPTSRGHESELLALHGIRPKVGEEPDFKTNLADALEPVAHPRTGADLLPLLIPSGGAEAVGKLLKPVTDAVSKYGGAAVELVESTGAKVAPYLPMKAKAALKVIGELKPSNWNSPLTVAGREGRAQAAIRKFNELPLSEQMKFLPETAAPVTTRGGDPIHQPQTPFSQRPLMEQMTELPGTAAPERGRFSGPPLRDTPEAIAASAPPQAAKPAVAAAPEAQGGLTAAEKAQLRKLHYPEAVIAKMDQIAAKPKTVAQASNEIAKELKQSDVKVSMPEHLAAANLIAKASEAGQVVSASDALSAVQEFAQTYGLPTEAEVAQVVAAKNARTSASTARATSDIRMGPDGRLVGRPGGNPDMPNQKLLNEQAIAARRRTAK